MRAMHYRDTKLLIRGRIEEFAHITGAPVQHAQDDFDTVLSIEPNELVGDLQSRFELFTYANAPGEPLVHVLSTAPERLQDIADLFRKLRITSKDVTCEVDGEGRAMADLNGLLKVLRQPAAANPLPPTAYKKNRRIVLDKQA